MTNTLFCFGLSYCAQALIRRLAAAGGWRFVAANRSPRTMDGVIVQSFDAANLAGATHILSSVPPDGAGDPVVRTHGAAIRAARPHWVGYISTTGVYGDTQGAWVDEAAPLNPGEVRSRRRVEAEQAWTALGVPLHIFRLPGIYGPGRSQIEAVRAGEARRIHKPGHVFSRIHVDDIAAAIAASIARPNPGAVYNVADDEPAPTSDLVAFACELLGAPVPPEVPLEQAGLSEMGRSFYAECRRVRNDRIKSELGVRLAYPTYREGLRAILAGG